MNTARRTQRTVKILVGRFGQDPQVITVTAPATVEKVLEKAEIDTESSERVWVNGSRATLRTKVKAGDIVAVVSPKEAGR